MSITDELRRYIHREMWDLPKWKDELPAIADRIDAEHERAVADAKGETMDAIRRDVDSYWVRLPVDTDGVPWHIGDRTESGQTVGAMGLNKYGWCFIGTVNEIDPSIHRHYHAPTVEDVLYDGLRHFGAVDGRTPEVDEWLCEQATKLREMLAGDGE